MNVLVGSKLNLALVAKAAGVVVDLAAYPAALTDVVWSVSDSALAAVNTTTPDGLKAELTGLAVGAVDVTVSGKNVNGDAVSKTFQTVVDPLPVPVVDELDVVAE